MLRPVGKAPVIIFKQDSVAVTFEVLLDSLRSGGFHPVMVLCVDVGA